MLKLLAILITVALCAAPAQASASGTIDPMELVRKMETAYAKVTDYQTDLEVRTYSPDGTMEEKRMRYTFKKPGSIRLDFKQPHAGMVAVYPDREGKVAARPLSWLPFVILHKELSDPKTQVSPGQGINQTDLGLLIKNIGRSVDDGRKGPVTVSSNNDRITISVPAEDHFQPDVDTRYTFFIDKKLWLPVRVEERDSERRLRRIVIFHDLTVNTGAPDSLFHLD